MGLGLDSVLDPCSWCEITGPLLRRWDAQLFDIALSMFEDLPRVILRSKKKQVRVLSFCIIPGIAQLKSPSLESE